MKKPNKLYRKLGGRRSTAGAAFAIARHPVRSLRSVFGWDVSAKDVAEGFNVAPSKHAYQMVMKTLETWSKSYRGPKLSWMFRMLSTPQSRKTLIAPKPEMD
ncbi:MAG: hypothetical protein A3J37_02380 [Alphaproteobacteria bacterium RIFCSPHIGHO2_12_FULL_45_9]|nr:MAG: hypothetical protein A3B66_04385 [Alphaproteobacteria bacterium RIFCSPHIGHO2_02_FULL_46_13]OFW95514.1 MAG: hypothetical protein A3J37_02380 [Alphaproteobacteria bacterium RIFCSPHIGHO2_12_FULL_45_9]